MEKPTRIILAITGASGAIFGIRALQMLVQAGVETHLVISHSAEETIRHETGWAVEDLRKLAHRSYDFKDIGASIASGSFLTGGMLVAPCSIKTLSGIANSYSNNLIVRAADVCLKEGRPLLLAVRETPLHRGHLRLMDLAAQAGAVIFPPIPSFYGKPQTLADLVDNLAARMLLRLGIQTQGYTHWEKGS